MKRLLIISLVIVGLLAAVSYLHQPVAQHHVESRSHHWPAVRKAHLEKEPFCAVCGTREGIDVHHVLPFHEHPELELVDSNLITLCHRDHFIWGHLGNWKHSNPDIRAQIKRYKRNRQ